MEDTIEPLLFGSFTYPDGSVYNGEWNLRGEKHGFGILTFSTGLEYKGHFDCNYFSGLGHLRFPNNSWYLGEFMNGWFHGQGIYQNPEGLQYVGYFRGGKLFGIGRFAMLNLGYCFDGNFREYKCIDLANCDHVVENVFRMCKSYNLSMEEVESDSTDESELPLSEMDGYETDSSD